eukprot:TRINITY_DN47439_c0_g1_i1.p1 TRINITY_DN47439_c0_g1~~TRINITY_DN47439_c0_g1_i1.p1  ORF type:complete len:381 (-),score=34.10 TRINITY_DN47439_c0_g1_i1:72-1214(-)
MDPRLARALSKIRDRLPNDALVHVVAFAPISWRCVIQPPIMQAVETMLKHNILPRDGVRKMRDGDDGEHRKSSEERRHWLEEYTQRGDTSAVAVSLLNLAEAVSGEVDSFGEASGQLDSDAVCALFMIRGCDLSRPFNVDVFFAYGPDEDENDDGEGGPENYADMYCTPLYAAVDRGNLDLVRLFLHGKAAPSGFQYFNPFLYDHGHEIRTPLYIATAAGSSSIVACLLEARADPNELGAESCLVDEEEGGTSSSKETALWRATEESCRSDPMSKHGKIWRNILRMLIEHGADPHTKCVSLDGLDPCEGSSEGSASEDMGSEASWSRESGARDKHADGISAFENALKRLNELPVDSRHCPEPRWASDVLQTLELAAAARK